jgi:[acyl-carrier-protein] S-malonyltransferase
MSLAFIFPGQGSQKVGMLAAHGAAHPVVRATFAEASEALGKDLWKLAQEGPEAELNLTENTQPALLAADVALWRAWNERQGPQPGIMAGHSLAEYAALTCAGALKFADAVRLVADRGRFMQEAVPAGQGAMAAIIGLEDAVVADLCREAAGDDVLEPVNFNAPGQVVVAGAAAAVERALALAAGRKARAVRLPVSIPAHSSLMAPAARRFAQRLQGVEIRAPEIPVVHNYHVRSEGDPEAIRNALARQLDSPVRWVETILDMGERGARVFVECGPGSVLSGLNRRIVKDRPTLSIETPEGLEKALATAAGG